MEKPGRLQSVGSLRVRHNWATSLSLFTFMHWRRKWQPTPVFLPGESQGQGSLVGCRLWGHTESDMTEVTLQQQQHTSPILECEIKWALESITTNKASGGDGIPVELFQILKDDAVKVLHSICQQIWNTQQCPQDWKRSVFIPIPKKAMPKNIQTTAQLYLSHMLVK